MTDPDINNPVFDKNQPVTTHRTMTGAKFSQNGHLFSLAHVYIGPDDSYEPPETETREKAIEPPVSTGKAGVLERASARLSEFSESTDKSDSMKENSKAKAAERLAV